ncbi:MAG: NifU N-terminal domain-containing protein [Armatimonadetes bacterium]|nr:NifU N-terminal domain-containing protein [Armatimonadota bacterium]
MADPVMVEVHPTPNVNALKFVVNRKVAEGRSQTYQSAEQAAAHPLAARLFTIPGVKMVFLLNDFITVTRDPAADWGTIAPRAEESIRGHFESQD